MSGPRNRRLWITWENQRRNETMSRELGADLYVFDYRGSSRVLRYIRALGATIVTVARRRPAVLFVQNPSLVLALASSIGGRLLRKNVVVDAHNAGIHPLNGRSKLLNVLATVALRSASTTIVSNSNLAAEVEQRGGRAVVVPDPLPGLRCGDHYTGFSTGFNVVVVCTWAEDEPYVDVLKAAEMADPDVNFYITGNSRGRERELGAPLPGNVTLTGFVSEADYVSMLFAADLIVDLTTRENCLVCGAYEAIAAETPLLLSETEVLRMYFGDGALFTDNTAPDIVRKIKEARSRHTELKRKITELRVTLSDAWPQYLTNLEDLLPPQRVETVRQGSNFPSTTSSE